MNVTKIRQLIERAQQDGESLEFFGPQSEAAIASVENALEIKFPSEYRTFLRELGGGGGIDNPFSGILADDPLSERQGSVFGDTMRARKDKLLPKNFIVIYFDFNSHALWVLDTTAQRSDGTTAVLDFSSPSKDSKPVVVAKTFGTLLEDWFGAGLS